MDRLALPGVQLLTAVASAATAVAVSLTLAASGWGTWVLSAVLIAGVLPSVVVAPALAPLLDTRHLPRLASVLLATEALFLLVGATCPTPPVLVGMVFLTGLCSCLSSPALLALSPARDEVLGARPFARMDTARTTGMFVGPILGGLLHDMTTVGVVILLEALAVILSAGIVLLVTFRVAGPGRVNSGPNDASNNTSSPAKTWWARIAEVPSLILRDLALRTSLLVLSIGIIFTAVFSVAEVLLATQVLGLSGLGYALIIQAFVVGRILGSRLGSHIAPTNAGVWLTGGGALMGAGLILAGLVHHVVPVGFGFLMAGVANALQVAAIRARFAATLPPRLMPKALSSLVSVNSVAMVVGMILAAPLIDVVGPATALIVGGACTAVVSLGAVLSATFRNSPPPTVATRQRSGPPPRSRRPAG
ncbi:MAG: MFS transporter [Corynebacterium sp.]|uniref:MFS transporter n=1 Tax=Corynebacterium sp. TaxID=1720 RepID=UPI003F9AFFBB